jgi:hypothetical protein
MLKIIRCAGGVAARHYFGEQVNGILPVLAAIFARRCRSIGEYHHPGAKYLSCALRCEENFSAEHLVAVLCA